MVIMDRLDFAIEAVGIELEYGKYNAFRRAKAARPYCNHGTSAGGHGGDEPTAALIRIVATSFETLAQLNRSKALRL